MRFFIGFAKAMSLLTLLAVLFQQSAYAQKARKIGNKPVTIRLCPSTCRAVNGHGLVPGGPVSVYESRGGWVRVSPYLNRKTLVPSFGTKITKKPALWMPQSALASTEAAKPVAKKKAPVKNKIATKPKAKKTPTAKRVSVVDRVARLRRIPRPVFRPNGVVQAPVTTTVSEPIVTTQQPVVQDVVVSEPVKVAEPVVVDSSPVTSAAKGSGSQKALSWEEVQAKIAAQGGGQAPTTRVVKTQDNTATKEAQEAAARANEAARLAAEKAKAAKQAKPNPVKQTAVVLPPKIAEPTAPTKPAATTEEPTFKSASADPISFGQRPKKLTKELMDKRLRKLPGKKSKVRKDVVIALRHYALGLLKSGECKGIAKGGATAAPGMLYIACKEDPTYLRQFPLIEESW